MANNITISRTAFRELVASDAVVVEDVETLHRVLLPEQWRSRGAAGRTA